MLRGRALRGGERVARAADELVGLPAPYPGPYADAFLGMLRARAVVSASALGVWRALPGTVEELAQRTETHPERLAVLLRALRALGYVHCRRGAWRASRRTRRFFGPAARTPLDATVGVLAASNWRVLAGLDDVIRGGSPPGLHGGEPDRATWVGYQASMVELNALVAAPVLDALGTPRRLLDIGGGPGAFALAACVRWPGVDVVVAELPQAASLGRERVRTAGRADRIRYIAGDAATAELGAGYDAVTILQVLHNLPREECVGLLRAGALAAGPEGRVTVLEFDGAATQLGALTSLLFCAWTGTRTYAAGELVAMAEEAGLRGVVVRRPPQLAGSVLVQGTTG